MLFALLGIAVGIAIGALGTAFVPACGEDCSNERLGFAVRWATLCMVAFPLVAYIATRNASAQPQRRYWLVACSLCLATLLPALTYYLVELRDAYFACAAAREVQVSTDFDRMAISEHPIPALNIAEAERCAFGPVACDNEPPFIEAICRQGVVNIPRKYWSSFKRLPLEDLPGLAPREDRFPNWCSS